MGDFVQAILEITFMAFIPAVIALVFAVIFFKRKAQYDNILVTDQRKKIHRGYRYIIVLSGAFIFANVLFGAFLTSSAVNFYKKNLKAQKPTPFDLSRTAGRPNQNQPLVPNRQTKIDHDDLSLQLDSGKVYSIFDHRPLLSTKTLTTPYSESRKLIHKPNDISSPSQYTTSSNDRKTLWLIFSYIVFQAFNLYVTYNVPFLYLILWIKKNFHKVGIDKFPIIVYAVFLIVILLVKTLIDLLSPMNKCPSTPIYKCYLVMVNVVFNVVKTLMSLGLILLMGSVPGSEILQMKITFRSGNSLQDENLDTTFENHSDLTDVSDQIDSSNDAFRLEIDKKQTLNNKGVFGHRLIYKLREALGSTPSTGTGVVSQNLFSDSFSKVNYFSKNSRSKLSRSLIQEKPPVAQNNNHHKSNPYGFDKIDSRSKQLQEPLMFDNQQLMMTFNQRQSDPNFFPRPYGSDLGQTESPADNGDSLVTSQILSQLNPTPRSNRVLADSSNFLLSQQTQFRKVQKELHRTEQQLISLAKKLSSLALKHNQKLGLFEDLAQNNLNLEQLETTINQIMNNSAASISAEEFLPVAHKLLSTFLEVPKLNPAARQSVWLRDFSLLHQFPQDFVLNSRLAKSIFPRFATLQIESTQRADTFKLKVLSSRSKKQLIVFKSLLSIQNFAQDVFRDLSLPPPSQHPSFKSELGYLVNVALNESDSPERVGAFLKLSRDEYPRDHTLIPTPETQFSLTSQFNPKSNSLEYRIDFRFGLFEPAEVSVVRTRGHCLLLENNLRIRFGADFKLQIKNFVEPADVREWLEKLLGFERVWESTEFRLFVGFHETD
ncbi:MAG: hypothetical protein AAFO91_01880 [Bacteroidota bacterium]